MTTCKRGEENLGEKNKKIQKKEIVRTVLIVTIICIAIYIVYMLYGLIKTPTNIFVVENGKLTMEEETIRIYNT